MPPTFVGLAQWILELDIFDETGGIRTITAQLANLVSESQAIGHANQLTDLIEALLPPNVILVGRLTKPVVVAAVPGPEAQVRKQIKIGFASDAGNSSFVINCPAKNTAGGLLISDNGLLIESNPQFIELKNELLTSTWLLPNGNLPTAYNGAVYECQPGKNHLGKF